MSPGAGGGLGLGGEVPLDRVVAVVGRLPGGRAKWGSGFLVDATHVLTAWHCTVRNPSSMSPLPFGPEELRILRYAEVRQDAPARRVTADDRQLAAVSWRRPSTSGGYNWGRDVAVLKVLNPPWGDPGWAVPEYRRLDRAQTGELVDCVAVGYPMYMVAAEAPTLQGDAPLRQGEVRGFIRFGDDLESGRFMLHDTDGAMPAVPPHLDPGQTSTLSPWGGLSGAAVFHHGRFLGHVVQHHPHRGGNQVSVVPVEEIAEGAIKPDSACALIARAIGLPALADLQPVRTAANRLWRNALVSTSLGADGSPQHVQEVTDLTTVGVHEPSVDPGVIAELGYVDRGIDKHLDAAFTRAAESTRLVLVVGDSAAGKSRVVLEAIRRHPMLGNRYLLAPAPGRGLQALLDADVPLENTVLWLDDLDKHHGEGLTVDLLARWRREHPASVCAATMRRQRFAALQQGLVDPMWDFLHDPANVTRFELTGGLSSREQDALAKRVGPDLVAAVKGGVGEWIIQAKELPRKLDAGDAWQKALAHAVIGWSRTGISNAPLPIADAQSLWTDYLPAAERAEMENLTSAAAAHAFQRSSTWLCESIIDLSGPPFALALAYETDGGLVAHDYLVDRAPRRPDRPRVSTRTWQRALDVAEARATAGEGGVDTLVSIGLAAMSEDEFAAARTAFGVLHGINYPMAGTNLAALLVLKNLPAEALVVCDQVRDRLSADGHLWSRVSIARALLVEHSALWDLNRHSEAIAALDNLIATYGNDETATVRRVAAEALLRRASALDDRGESGKALASCHEVLEVFGEDPDPQLAEWVARAIFTRATIERGHGDREAAIAAYQDLIDRFGCSDYPPVRVVVAEGTCNMGLALAAEPPRLGEAIAAFELADSMFADDTAPDVREQAAKAHFSLAVVLERAGLPKRALATYRSIDERYRSEPTPATRGYVAESLCQSARLLAVDGQYAAARAQLEDLRDRYADDENPQVRQTLVKGGEMEAEMGAEV